MSFECNHFISRFLIKNWLTYHNKQRLLCYYDFHGKKIEYDSQKRIVARRRVYSELEETSYKRLIEDPLDHLIRLPLSDGKLQLRERKLLRSLYLIFLFQYSRTLQALDPLPHNHFSQLLKKDENELDAMVQIMSQHSSVYLLTVPNSPKYLLNYPLLGQFPILCEDPETLIDFTTAYGIPLTPTRALILCSKSVDINILNIQDLSKFSVGLAPTSNQIIIPPQAAESIPHARIIENIEQAREGLTKLYRLHHQTRFCIESIGSILGFSLDRVPGSCHGELRYVNKDPRSEVSLPSQKISFDDLI